LIKTFQPIFKPKYIVTIFCDNDKDVTDTSNYFYIFYFQKNNKTYFLKDNKINYSQNVGVYFNAYRKWLNDKTKPNEGPLTSKLGIYSPEVFKLPIIRSATTDFFKKIKNYYLFLPLPTKFLIDELQRNQEKFSTIHIITYIPPNEKFINDYWERHYENNIKKYAKSKKIIFIDYRKAMHAYDNAGELYQPNGTHLSKKGYELLSKVIIENLN